MNALGQAHIEKHQGNLNVASRIHSLFSTAQSLINVDANLALNYIHQIIDESKKHNYEIGIAKGDLLLSAYHWFHGDIERALEANEKAQQTFEMQEDFLHLSIAIRLQGMIFGELGDIDQCLEHYYDALIIQEKIGDKKQLAITHNNIATAQMKMGAKEQGLQSYQKALDLLEELNSNEPQILTSKAMICTNMGQAYSEIHDQEKSLFFHKLSLKWSEQLDKKSRLVAQTYYHIGFHYLEAGEYENALKHLFKSLEIAEKLQNKRLISDIYLLIAKCYCHTRKFKEALQNANKQRELCKKNEIAAANTDILNSHKIFAEIYENMKDYGRAVFHYKKVMELNEKIKQQDKAVYIRNKNIRYQLEKQKSELQQSNADLQMFASIASHDMRAPLRTIASFLQLLERKNQERFDETDKQYLKFAINGAKHLEKMIEDLLTYSKLEKDLGECVLIDLNKVATIVEHNLKTFINEKNAVLNIGKLPSVPGHQSLMIQLFQNIINNGIKYNRSKVPTISVNDVSDNRETIIAITDNGIGIPEAQRKKAFKMFSRLHSASEFEGSGIGLAMCQKIMDYYKGRIWIEDAPQGGSVFYLAFPINPQPQNANCLSPQ
jgi:signal transduction histidine kinase